MIGQIVKSISHPLAMVLLGIYCTVAQAEVYDITELQQPGNSSPAMTGFYTVTSDGETTLEDPVESGFALDAGSDFDPDLIQEEEPESDTSEKTSEKASNSKKQETRTVRIRVKRKQPERNRADQSQCERHGFYYTNDGRCILPAYQHYLPAIPQPLPGGSMHPGMPD